MSTTTYTRPLNAVPDIPSSTKARFAALLYMRLKAQQAFDKALSLPRSAIRWAISLFQRWADATASIGVFSWLGQQARSATGIIRSAGVLPVSIAVLSTPPIAGAATRLAGVVGNGVGRLASSAWRGLKGILSRRGSTGARISEALAVAGAKVASVVGSVATHPMVAPIARVLRATMALVRPISQGFVAHRLLGLLVPMAWLRTVIGFLVMPLLIDPPCPKGFGISTARDRQSHPPTPAMRPPALSPATTGVMTATTVMAVMAPTPACSSTPLPPRPKHLQMAAIPSTGRTTTRRSTGPRVAPSSARTDRASGLAGNYQGSNRPRRIPASGPCSRSKNRRRTC